jgi:hypothetical protein
MLHKLLKRSFNTALTGIVQLLYGPQLWYQLIPVKLSFHRYAIRWHIEANTLYIDFTRPVNRVPSVGFVWGTSVLAIDLTGFFTVDLQHYYLCKSTSSL